MTGRTLRITQVLIFLVLICLLTSCTAATISCPNGDAYSISTGARRGNCDRIYSEGGVQIVGGECNDGLGNSAYFSCDAGCLSMTGSGKCELVD